MCGILALFNKAHSGNTAEFRQMMYTLSQRQVHRGPDWSGLVVFPKTWSALAHERLSIIGTSSGSQPIASTSQPDTFLAVNGEIYNYKQLIQENKESAETPYNFATGSDCEVILPLVQDALEKGHSSLVENIGKLGGMFAFVFYDSVNHRYVAARDPIGIIPLYQGWGSDGSIWFASEMKCLADVCERISVFPPGHYYDSQEGKCIRYYAPHWMMNPKSIPTGKTDLRILEKLLVDAVRSQMMSEVPFGVLLSGGLDSSLIASIAVKIHKETSSIPLKTFSIGLKGAPDLIAAQTVADFLGTDHHSFIFTLDEAIDAVESVIRHLETFDVTTIRASTPMYLLARHIKSLGVKMVLSGEGSDEIFGGYLYFHNAPSSAALHEECVERVKNLHLSDCLRANKSTMAWGLEVRPPFLDCALLDYAMGSICPEDKMSSASRMEKTIVRQAFDPEFGAAYEYLPSSVLWRQKEQFSDGVGYSWIDSIKSYAESFVNDERMSHAASIFPINPPATKEAFYYRQLFDKMFPTAACAGTVMKWVPRQDWGCSADPSGRAQKVHVAALTDQVKKRRTSRDGSVMH